MENRVRNQLQRQGVTVESMFSTPEPFSILLCRVLASTPDDRVIDAITGVFDNRPAETLMQPLNTSLPRNLHATPALNALLWQTASWQIPATTYNPIVVPALPRV